MTTLKPQRLRKGDVIGLAAPASAVTDPSKINRGVRYLERLGYRVTMGEHVGKVHGYLAGTDRERVADLHALFADRRVKAIIAIRGGYGTPRLLSMLDYRLISRNPKILVGFSDITALQLALWKQCRLLTFHGPMAGVEMAGTIDPFTEEQFWRTVTSTKPMGRIRFPVRDSLHVLQTGTATGRLMGGNLSLVVSLLGTHYFPVISSAVLFLEETGEEPYRVDRMMTQLRNAGVMAGVGAVLTGAFSDCKPGDKSKPSLSVEDVLTDAARLARKPFVSGMPFGHVRKKITLPVGLRVKVNAERPSMEFLEAAVS